MPVVALKCGVGNLGARFQGSLRGHTCRIRCDGMPVPVARISKKLRFRPGVFDVARCSAQVCSCRRHCHSTCQARAAGRSPAGCLHVGKSFTQAGGASNFSSCQAKYHGGGERAVCLAAPVQEQALRVFALKWWGLGRCGMDRCRNVLLLTLSFLHGSWSIPLGLMRKAT